MRGFVVLPKRWIVERFFAHLMRSRRLVRDFERSIASAEAMVYWSMTMLMTLVVQRTPDQDTCRLALVGAVAKHPLQRLDHHLVRQRGWILEAQMRVHPTRVRSCDQGERCLMQH